LLGSKEKQAQNLTALIVIELLSRAQKHLFIWGGHL
jgi:hypothetical protein